jgi:hypothetical protein
MADIFENWRIQMKNLLIAATALATLASAPAFAQVTTAPGSATATVTFTGNVAAACSVTNATATAPLGNLTTGVGTLNAAAVNIAFPAVVAPVVCNGAGTQVQVTANQITRNGPSLITAAATAAGFADAIDYTATVALTGFSSAAVSSIADSTSTLSSPTTVGLLALTGGSLTLSGAALPGTATTLIAGGYTGSVGVTIVPGV